MRLNVRFALLIILFFPYLVFASETIVTKRVNAQNRLIPLKKVTIGPDDQYHGSVDPSGQLLVFTRKSDMIPHLCVQDLKSGEVKDLLDRSADSQAAAYSPEGLVAFIYYKFNARGDICYRKPTAVDAKDFTCLKSDENERSSPFWRNAREIGYLVRNLSTQVSQIVTENIDTGKKQVLAEGPIWSPAMRSNGRYLFFNQLVNQASKGGNPGRALAYKDLQTNQIKILHFDIPGMSGFPAVSDDERYLFFSQYLNDTRHDNIIDARDNSVILRVPIAELSKLDNVLPEQLTSAENNCSFPRPFQDQLFVTCAFEGSLDVYQLPASGIVPSKWDENLLWSAHESSRTYQDRILILNTLKYRFTKLNGPATDEKLFTDHILNDDTSAAQFYLGRVASSATKTHQDFYNLLRLYLVALDLKKAQPAEDEVSEVFRGQILGIDGQIEKIKNEPRFKQIVRGLLRTFINQPQASQAFLKQVQFKTTGHPLERYFYFELADWTLLRTRSLAALAKVYREMMNAPEISHESRVYYTFSYLQHLQDTQPLRSQRIKTLSQFNQGLLKPVADLLHAEQATLEVIEANESKVKQQAYARLDALMTSNHKDYFLAKAIYIRSILNFADAAEFIYLNFIANNWMTYTATADTEFTYAREVYINANLDRAYETYAQKKYQLAADYFYASVTLTDDIESHYGYIKAMVLNGQRKTLDARYANLKKREFIDDNFKFVNALLLLIDAGPKAETEVGPIDEALKLLSAMTQDRDSSMRYLLMGYLKTKKLFLTANGYDFDGRLFEDAHRALMLAYDTGRENDRIRASALMDLGLLHQRVQNHGLAVRFFARRKSLGFTSPDLAAAFEWFFARSLFYSHQYDQAALEIKQAIKLAVLNPKFISENDLFAFKERFAFYSQVAGNYENAADAYAELLRSQNLNGDLNLAKAYLGYGFSLFKLKNSEAARYALTTALAHTDNLVVVPRGKDRLVDFQPLRLKLDAYGLLAQLGADEQRLDALAKRAELLPYSKGIFDDGLALTVQNRLQMAYLYRQSNPAQAAVKLAEAAEMSQQLVKAGQPLSHAVYEATVDILVHGSLHPQLYQTGDSSQVKSLVDKTVSAYQSQKNRQPLLDYQRLKIQILWAAYANRVLKSQNVDFASLRKQIEGTGVYARELSSLADAAER